MSRTLPQPVHSVKLTLDAEERMSDDEYYELCAANPDLRFERNAQGEVIIELPAGFESDYRNLDIAAEIRNWARRDGRGKAFGPTALLPSGAAYSLNASWVSNARLEKQSKDEKQKFPRLVPEFVVELISSSDRLKAAQKKMEDWMADGVELGWLVDADRQTVYIYRAGHREPEVRSGEAAIRGEGPIAGFELPLIGIRQGLSQAQQADQYRGSYPDGMNVVLPESVHSVKLTLDAEERMTDDEYYELCAANPDLRFERNAQGEIIIVPPAGFESDHRNSGILTELTIWARKDKRGKAFGPTAEYLLPSGAAYSPDASWVSNARLEKLSKDQKRKFPRLVPEFVVELMSPSDRLKAAQKKMEDWIADGVELGWLIDADRQTVYIYRAGHREPEVRSGEPAIRGEGPVAGLELSLIGIWEGL